MDKKWSFAYILWQNKNWILLQTTSHVLYHYNNKLWQYSVKLYNKDAKINLERVLCIYTPNSAEWTSRCVVLQGICSIISHTLLHKSTYVVVTLRPQAEVFRRWMSGKYPQQAIQSVRQKSLWHTHDHLGYPHAEFRSILREVLQVW